MLLVIVLILPTGCWAPRHVNTGAACPAALAALRGGLVLLPLCIVATGYGVRVMLQLFMWIALASPGT